MDPGILQIETVLLISLYMSILDLYFYLIFRARQLSKCVDGIAFLENFFLGASRIYLIGSEIFLYIGRQLILFFFFIVICAFKRLFSRKMSASMSFVLII